MVKTAEISSRKIGWILNNVDSIWYNGLFSVVRNLICQYVIMSFNFACPTANIFRILLCNILCTISIFKYGFENLIIKWKFMIFITNIGISQINLNILKYDSDLDVLLFATSNSAMSSLPDTPLPSTDTCAVYIDVVAKTKATSKKTVKKEKKVIL